MKKYSITTLHRGQQITKMVCAKNLKDAATLLSVSTYFISNYGSVCKIEKPFIGIVAYFDSGFLFEKEPSLIKVEMSIERLKAIVDSYRDKEYDNFKKQMGIK